jgi:predicted metal-binding membrane protein
MTSTTSAERVVIAPGRAPGRGSRRMAALLFLAWIASAAVTIAWGSSMSSMGGMPMPGGWTMSMTWMRMPGQTWPGAAASFLGMWIVMMVAMMLPSLVPMLWRFRELAGQGKRLDWLTAGVIAGYFFVWAGLGAALFPIGIALAEVEMQQPALARAVPLAVGVVVLVAGMVQFTTWKARHLACCREAGGPRPATEGSAGAAWQYGRRFGVHCIQCCAGPTAILVVMGVMDLAVMAAVAAAVNLERLAPAGERVAHGIGIVAVAAGLLLIARAGGLG